MSSKENTLSLFGKARKGELIYIKKKKKKLGHVRHLQ